MVAGDGVPVVVLPFHHAHIERRWTAAGGRWTRLLAECFRVITYDSRGQGLSARNLQNDPTLDDYRSDLEAVLEAAAVEGFALVAYGGFGHVALRYAIEHPEQVKAVVLICTCESFSAWPLAGLITLAEENWDLFVDLLVAKAPPDAKDRAIAFIQACATPADYVRMVRAFSRSSVSELLPQVRQPVLILHSLDQHWLSVDEGTKFAARVDGSRLVFLNGDVEPNDVEGTRAIQTFLNELHLNRAPTQIGPLDFDATDVPLTERQKQVLRLIGHGKSNREIAEQLVLSERTVERHVSDAYAKIGTRNRVKAAAYASDRLMLD